MERVGAANGRPVVINLIEARRVRQFYVTNGNQFSEAAAVTSTGSAR